MEQRGLSDIWKWSLTSGRHCRTFVLQDSETIFEDVVNIFSDSAKIKIGLGSQVFCSCVHVHEHVCVIFCVYISTLG